MGTAHSRLECCCANREKEESFLQRSDTKELEREASERRAVELAELNATACMPQKRQRLQQQQEPQQHQHQQERIRSTPAVAPAQIHVIGRANSSPSVVSENLESKVPAPRRASTMTDLWWQTRQTPSRGTLPEHRAGCGTGNFPTPPEELCNQPPLQDQAAKLEISEEPQLEAPSFDSQDHAKIEMSEEPERQLQAEGSFEQMIGALFSPCALNKLGIPTQVDTPEVQDFRLTRAEASEKDTETGGSTLQALPETPRWMSEDKPSQAICMEAFLHGGNSDPPPPPRPGFRTTSIDSEAERAAEWAESNGGSSGDLSNSLDGTCRQAVILRTKSTSALQEKHQWSVNSDDSLVAELAGRMRRKREGRVPDNQQQKHQRRGCAEPQLEAKLADRMEQQLSKERTGVGSAALRQQRTFCEGGATSIGFVDKTLERRLELQRLKAEGRRPK